MSRRGCGRGAPFNNNRFTIQDSRFIGPLPWSQLTQVPPSPPQDTRNVRPRGPDLRAGFINVLRNLVAIGEIHNVLSVLAAASLFFLRCIFSVKELRCMVALSPIYPSFPNCSIIPQVLLPFCHFLQELPTGQDLCNRPLHSPLEQFYKDFLASNVTSDLIPPGPLRQNLASESKGATIIRELTSVTHGRVPCSGSSEADILSCNLKHNGHINTPAVVLEEDFRVGECWEFFGGIGQLAINLSDFALLSHVAIDYPSPLHLSPYARLRAPKKISLWILVDNVDNIAHAKGIEASNIVSLPISYFRMRPGQDSVLVHRPSPPLPSKGVFIRVVEFEYQSSLTHQTRQIFAIEQDLRVKGNIAALRVESNYGGETTCLYWVGLFGVV